jgi:hypothetical protein
MRDPFGAIEPVPARERHCAGLSRGLGRGTRFDARETPAAEVSIDTVVRLSGERN